MFLFMWNCPSNQLLHDHFISQSVNCAGDIILFKLDIVLRMYCTYTKVP